MGGTEPGAALSEEGMGTSYQAFCIAQHGLAPWPFGVQRAEEEEQGEAEGGAAGADERPADEQQRPSEQPQSPGH